MEQYSISVSVFYNFVGGQVTIGHNGPGIATVADLRASSLTTVTKDQAEQRPQNYHQAPLLWLYHVELNPAWAG